MPSTANLLTDTQLSERLTKVGEGVPDAAAVMVVEWRARAKALRLHANFFLGFIVLALIAGIGFVWLADVLVEQGIKAAGMAQIDVFKQREQTEIDLLRKRKDDALNQLEEVAEELEERRVEIITAMEAALLGGGSLWIQQDSGTTSSLYSIHFADSRKGWVIGDGGTIDIAGQHFDIDNPLHWDFHERKFHNRPLGCAAENLDGPVCNSMPSGTHPPSSELPPGTVNRRC